MFSGRDIYHGERRLSIHSEEWKSRQMSNVEMRPPLFHSISEMLNVKTRPPLVISIPFLIPLGYNSPFGTEEITFFFV